MLSILSKDYKMSSVEVNLLITDASESLMSQSSRPDSINLNMFMGKKNKKQKQSKKTTKKIANKETQAENIMPTSGH